MNFNMRMRKPNSKNIELAKESEKLDVCPCRICTLVKDPENCTSAHCYSFDCWFKQKWENIQKKGERIIWIKESDNNA